MANNETGLMTSNIQCRDIVTSRSYIQQPAKQSQVEKFRATQVFHTKFTANVAIIRWTMPLEKAFYLPQLCFSFFFFGFASGQAKSCCEKNKFRY